MPTLPSPIVIVGAGQSGLAFPGDPDHYPSHDEVAGYLERYAEGRHRDPYEHARRSGRARRRGLRHAHRHRRGGASEWDRRRDRFVLQPAPADRVRTRHVPLDGDQVIWSDGSREPVDVVLFATGYRPSFGYLRPLGALDEHASPIHQGGISLTHPGRVYLGIEFQRSFSSNTLRGVGRDADFVIPPLIAYATNAPAAVGL